LNSLSKITKTSNKKMKTKQTTRLKSVATMAVLLAFAVIIPSGTAQVVVFSTDFDSGTPAQFTGVTNTESVQGYAGIGPAGNKFRGLFLRNASLPPALPTTLTLTGLPPHTEISLSFLFAAIDTWDGNFSVEGAPVPDYFNITVDGTNIFSQTFCNYNYGGGIQSYVPPAGVLLTPKPYPELGFQIRPGNPPEFGDSAYDLGLDPAFQNIAHTASTLTVSWFANGAGWQGGDDESWAIDNVTVTALLVPPTLSIATSGQSLALSWPVSFSNYHLESTVNLFPPVQWQTVTNSVTNLGAVFSVMVPLDNTARFFRLEYQHQ
jgi:hypothetical protein